MMMYTMRRYGVPLPVAVDVDLDDLRRDRGVLRHRRPAGHRLRRGAVAGQQGNVLGLSLYDLFLGSLGDLRRLGVLMAFVMFFPTPGARLSTGPPRRSAGGAPGSPSGWSKLRAGIDEAHESMVAFNTPRGWLALLWATILSGRPTPTSSWPGTWRSGRWASKPISSNPAGPDPDHLPALLRADPGRLGRRRGAVGRGDVVYVPRGAHADLHPDLAADPQLLHHRVRIPGLFALGAARAQGGG